MIISMDGSTPILAGVMIPTCGDVERAGHAGQGRRDDEDEELERGRASSREKSTRVSLSRMAISTSPAGERVMARQSRKAPQRHSAVAT